MAKDYVGPRTPPRQEEPATRVIVTPPTPQPVRRTLAFRDIPGAGANNAPLYSQLTRYVEPISDEEAAAFGVPFSPNRYEPLASPETGAAEDRSMTEERFGVDSVADTQAAAMLVSIPPHAPRTGARRPTMGRRR